VLTKADKVLLWIVAGYAAVNIILISIMHARNLLGTGPFPLIKFFFVVGAVGCVLAIPTSAVLRRAGVTVRGGIGIALILGLLALFNLVMLGRAHHVIN
jgi:hypothetical protein